MHRTFPAILLAALCALSGAAHATENSEATGTVATFAAGCYWCVERDFDQVPGVLETTPGFMGGFLDNPTYDEVGTGLTGHTEVVRVRFDPVIVSYQSLLDYYWRHVDPTDGDGQFCDRGTPYRPAIFAHTREQKMLAEASKAALDASGKLPAPIAVSVEDAGAFWPAPDPDFYLKNPIRYKFFRFACGRDARIDRIWKMGRK